MQNKSMGFRSVGSRRVLLALVPGLMAVLVVAAITVGGPVACAQSPSEGQAIFQQRCVACHTVGGGPLVGPDLKGVTARRERNWLIRWISRPDETLAAGDPIATRLLQEFKNVPMPNQGVTEAQARSLVAYLEAQSGGAAAPPATQVPVAASLPGDPVIGKALFTGSIAFRNGGPPCMGCHSIAGIGALGGGALGPDLTPAYAKFRDPGMASILAAFPFPTMTPIFRDRPLTAEEQAHLRVFLQQAVAERPTQAVGQLTLLAVAGAAILLGGAHLLWRHRLTEVRRAMVGRAG